MRISTMPGQRVELYKVQNKDIPRAGAVLADAFQHDPVWERVLEGVEVDLRRAFFQGPVRYCRKYGDVYATSELLEGVAACVTGDLADMTVWRMLRTGSTGWGMRMGMEMAKLGQRMRPVFDPLEADRRANMKGRDYLYLMIIGVASQFQGQGFGGRLLAALVEESEQARVPLYLETATERNVRMYERLGFRQLKQITLPVIDRPQWEMVREPIA
jgi:ribosomal protein S18 acetylase RimI-like enzyme